MEKIKEKILGKELAPRLGIRDFLRYIGPGILVTVGFIDPGNWATNLSAGGEFGHSLLWVLALSTFILIFLQHNVAHLGIVSGYCLSEAATEYLPKKISVPLLISAMLASISTSLAEILGGAIALRMLLKIPLFWGAIITTLVTFIVLFSNSYKRLEKWIIALVSLVGLCFIYELFLVNVSWPNIVHSTFVPTIPQNSMPIIMAMIGAVVMPHNLFLHSEFIQSRKWNLENESIIKKQLKFEFLDTLLGMVVGFVINAAIVIIAAETFFKAKIPILGLEDAQGFLSPLLGQGAQLVFAIALLLSAFSASITSALAGGSIFSGIFKEPFNMDDKHSRMGIYLSLLMALIIIFFVTNPLKALIYSQIFLSIQLPFTLFLQIYLTSSKKVMGKYANSKAMIVFLFSIGLLVTYFNMRLIASSIF